MEIKKDVVNMILEKANDYADILRNISGLCVGTLSIEEYQEDKNIVFTFSLYEDTQKVSENIGVDITELTLKENEFFDNDKLIFQFSVNAHIDNVEGTSLMILYFDAGLQNFMLEDLNLLYNALNVIKIDISNVLKS